MRAELTALFQRLVDELPPGTAIIETSQRPGHPTVIKLKPANPEAAEFGVVCDDLDVYNVGFGFQADWEFPYERRYWNGEKDVLTEIEEMARAVIAGNCEEERGRFSMTGRIELGEFTYSSRNMPKFSKTPGMRKYGPYEQRG